MVNVFEVMLFYFIALVIFLPLLIFGFYTIFRVGEWALGICINNLGDKIDREKEELMRECRERRGE